GPDRLCIGGICRVSTLPPDCEFDDECDDGHECVAGTCSSTPLRCQVDSDCSFGKCVDGECKSKMNVEGGGCGCRAVGAGGSDYDGFAACLALIGLVYARTRGSRREKTCG
ncbi:MAG: hypothetical protein FWD57_16170, partial [Polyangiaceae bacterium]|nr:hypothetical protein [Polyangiaceae bacterium]